MTKLTLLGTSALRSVAFVAFAVAAAAPSFAQEVAAEQETPGQSEAEVESGTNAQDDGGQPIVVTGSRIRRPNLESNVPITSVGGEEFFQTGTIAVGDVLNELPALRSTVSQSNSTLNLGTSGLNLLDLRGLGTSRTLVLVNGRRHVAADILLSASSVDVNQIPTDLIERVDIVTGGNSAIYGSDAIAGVVNFVLKRDFEGLQIRGQGGISSHDDTGNYYVSALAGKNFADGRGNIALNVEFNRQNQYLGENRELYRVQRGFVAVDTDPASAVNGSDGNPDRKFFQDYRSAAFSDAGHFLVCCTTGPSPGSYYIPYIFEPNGTLIPQTGTRIGNGPFGQFLNANRGSTFRDRGQLQLLPQIERLNVNLIGHYTVSDAFEPFFEAKYVRTKSFGTGFSGPAFMQLGSTFGSPRERFFSDNPFLNPQAANIIRGALGDYYTDFNKNRVPDYYEGEYTGGNGIDDFDEFGFTILKNLIDLGVRDERAKRETYRIVGGVRGTFNGDWTYEVSGNYGRFDESTLVGGNLNVQRFLLAMDAVRNPANGQIVCRSQLDPSARVALETARDQPFAKAQLAQDVAQCVPINLFGLGNITPAARDYVLSDTFSKGRITQAVLNGFVSGDTSEFFELPGGPIGFALGAEYRRETAFFKADPLVEAGLTFYNALLTFDPPSFEVKEAFGEIRVPILKDIPFFHELTLNAAGRVANYKGKTGTVFAWNVGGEWSPIRDIRFRGNFSRAVRAPGLSDLYSPLGQNFATIDDPCSARNIGAGSPNRQANCKAAGIPTTYDYVYTQSLEFQSGGNPDLSEESSDSFTIGGVLQPRFLPGFSLSVDYYDIKVNDVITSPSAQQIIDACYDSPTANNQFCSLFQRAGAGGGPRGEIPFRILETSLRAVPLNYAALKVRGIDVEAGYRRNLHFIDGSINARVNYTRVFQNDAFLDPQDPTFADQYLFELGDPRDLVNFHLDVKSGPFTIGYQMRYIGKQIAAGAEYEDYFSKQGRPPQNADFAEFTWNPDVFYHDVRLGIEAGKNFEFYMGVDNIGDRMPPFASQGIGLGSAIYNNVGRFFYAGATAKF